MMTKTARTFLLATAAAAAIALCVGPGAAAPAATIPLHGFAIVPGESSATFAVPDNRGGFTGHTTHVTGRVEVEPTGEGDTYVARITGSIDARTLTTDVGVRDRAMHTTFLQ